MEHGWSRGAQPPVDMALGLGRARGREALYRTLLGLFVEHHGASARHIREALARGEADAASRLAHALKGSSAQVGALHVEAHAAQVEQQLRQGVTAHPLEPLLQSLEDALNQAVGWLRQRDGANDFLGPNR